MTLPLMPLSERERVGRLGVVPSTVNEYLRFVFSKSPIHFVLFFLYDLIHQIRVPLTSFILSTTINELTQLGSPNGELPSQVLWSVGAVAFVHLFGEMAHGWSGFVSRDFKPRMRLALRADLLEASLRSPHEYLACNATGALARKITELPEASLRMMDCIRHWIWSPVLTMVFSLILLTYTSWQFAAVLILYIGAYVLTAVLPRKRIAGESFDFSEQRNRVSGHVVDVLANAEVIRLFENSDFEIAYHGKVSNAEVKSHRQLLSQIVELECMRRLLSTAMISLMFALCIYGWSQGQVSLGTIAMVMALSLTLIGSAWNLAVGLTQFVEESGLIANGLNALAGIQDVKVKECPALIVDRGNIDFDKVTFQYGKTDVFRNFSLHIPAGQRVGLVGVSGAGKTTLVKLLLGLLEVNEGKLRVDGQNVFEHLRSSLRNAIAVIPQSTQLFNRTIIENICYGNPNATEEEAIHAAQIAQAHDFIMSLPQGYRTLLGENGVSLSGGQRQRIAIARAVLRNAPILLLDEATSALDSESEHAVQATLQKVMVGKTVIAIAHRLSTLKSLDRILVLEKGHIIEDGSHSELLQQNGAYARLWNMQSGQSVPSANNWLMDIHAS